jgi:hypothetical protein
MPAQVLQIAAYGEPFLAQLDADYGLVRATTKDAVAGLTITNRSGIRVLLTMGTVGATDHGAIAQPRPGLLLWLGL